MFSSEYLRTILDYNHETGIFIWKKDQLINFHLGAAALFGTKDTLEKLLAP